MKQVVCVQGLGFVGAAMAVAIALAEDEKGDAIYEVIGVDLNSSIGKTRVDSINQGKFPFKSSDLKLEKALKKIKSRKGSW
jgi:UDP-N-acetyl-D-mannosaminuronate dehydrogenase